MRHAGNKGFSLVELLASIAIIAVLVLIIVPWVANYVTTAQKVSDRQTLTQLNDALNRYKGQGGDISALTEGAPIANVMSKLRGAITWEKVTHRVLQAGYTVAAASLEATGDKKDYHFTRYNTANDNFVSTAPEYSSEGPYGSGIGYFTCIPGNGDIWYDISSSTGHTAFQNDSGTIIIDPPVDGVPHVPEAGSYKFWACASASDSTLSGNILSFENYSAVGTLDMRGFKALSGSIGIGNVNDIKLPTDAAITRINLGNNNTLNTFSFVGSSTLLEVYIDYNSSLASINLASNPNLLYVEAQANVALNSLNLAACANLTTVDLSGSNLSANGLNTVYRALPTNNSGQMYVGGNPGINGDTPSIATKKGWKVNGTTTASDLKAIHYIALGYSRWDPAIQLSENGTDWVPVEFGCVPNEDHKTMVSVGGTLYVACGSNIIKSTDNGATWSVCGAISTYGNPYIAAGSGKIAIVGEAWNGDISSDGNNWSTFDIPFNSQYIVYGNGRFVVTAGSDGQLITSTDGVTWTPSSTPSGWNSHIYFLNGRFFSAQWTGTVIYTSTDAVTWTPITVSNTTTSFTSIGYVAGQYVILGDYGAAYTSPDLITWSANPLPTGNWDYLRVVGSKLIAIEYSQRYAESTDGINWTIKAIPSSTIDMIYR